MADSRRGFFQAFRPRRHTEPPLPASRHRAIAEPPASPPTVAVPAKTGWFQRLKAGLARTSTALTQSLSVITKRKLGCGGAGATSRTP